MPEPTSESTPEPRTAFKGGLKPFESAPEYTRNSIFLSGANPEKVVRRINSSGETHQQSLMATKGAKILTNELSAKYGIHVPAYDIVEAPDTELNEPVVYIVTDKIHGHNITDKNIPPEVVKDNFQKFEDFYSSLISYLGDTYVNGGNMLTDIDPNQFMIGHTAKDPHDNIYLVDLDPWTTAIKPLGANKEQQDMIFSNFFTTFKCMKATEEKAEKQLTTVRQNLLNRLQAIPSSSRNGYYADSIQPILDDLQKAA